MLFNAGAKASGLAALVGALANTGRLILIDEFHVPWQLAVGLAAVIIGVLAQLFVSRASLSRVALSVPAVVIMIPGVPFYRAISALNDRAVDADAHGDLSALIDADDGNRERSALKKPMRSENSLQMP